MGDVKHVQIPYVPPIEHRSDYGASKVSTPAISSIEDAAPTASFIPSKPVLPPPNPIPKVLEGMVRLEAVTNRYSNAQADRVEASTEKMLELDKEQALALEKACSASENVTFWGVLQDIGSSVGSALLLSQFFNGYATGGFLVASGVLTLTNMALKHAQVWDWAADQIAGDNEMLRESIKTYLPAAIGMMGCAMGVYGAWTHSTLTDTDHILSITQTASKIAEGVSTFANQMSSASLKRALADSSHLQATSELIRMSVEKLMEEIKTFQKGQAQVHELATTLIHQANQAIQSTLQPA